jgi:hypothetical protein
MTFRRVRENWAVPPGLYGFYRTYPALKRGAKLARPSGAGFLSVRGAPALPEN